MRVFYKKSTKLGRHRNPEKIEQPAPSLSYYSRRSDQEINTGRDTQREARQSRIGDVGHFWIRRFGLVILSIAILICAIDVLQLSTTAEVLSITANTSSASFLHSQSTYQAAASKILGSSIWNRNKLTINTGALSNKLIAQFPELTHVSVTIPLISHHPIIYIQPSQPALIINGANGTFVLGTNGEALLNTANTDVSLASLNLATVTDQSGLNLSLDHQALTPSDVSFIQTVVAQLAYRHLIVSNMVLPSATRELDVSVKELPYFIKFNLESADARQQAGTFLATQARLQSQNITPAHYIDVRVDGRAYYL